VISEPGDSRVLGAGVAENILHNSSPWKDQS